MKTKSRPILVLAVGILGLLPAALCAAYGTVAFQEIREWSLLGTYAATTGQAIQTDIRVSGSRSVRLTPRVQYSYTVNGVEYSSTRTALGGGIETSSMTEAQKWVTAWNQGPLQVWYDPAAPQNALLSKSVNGGKAVAFAGFSLMFGVFAAAIWLKTIPRRLRPPPTEARLIASGLSRDTAGTLA